MPLFGPLDDDKSAYPDTYAADEALGYFQCKRGGLRYSQRADSGQSLRPDRSGNYCSKVMRKPLALSFQCRSTVEDSYLMCCADYI